MADPITGGQYRSLRKQGWSIDDILNSFDLIGPMAPHKTIKDKELKKRMLRDQGVIDYAKLQQNKNKKWMA